MPKQWITDPDEMEAILHNCQVCSMATVAPDGAPYVVILNYVYYDRKIYVHGAKSGKKLENIAHDSRVCLAVYRIDGVARGKRAIQFSTRYRSVVIFGNAKQIIDPAAKKQILTVLTEKYATEPFETPTEDDVSKTAVVEISIDRMTGKRNIDP